MSTTRQVRLDRPAIKLPAEPKPADPTFDPEQTCQWDVRLHSDGVVRFHNIRPYRPGESDK